MTISRYSIFNNGGGKVFLFLAVMVCLVHLAVGQKKTPALYYTLKFSDLDRHSHTFQVEVEGSGWSGDTLEFKMPKWMPGYYQIMDYAKSISGLTAMNEEGKEIPVISVNENTWKIRVHGNKRFRLHYRIKAEKQFVANSYVDEEHAYISPCGAFLYINGKLNTPVHIKVQVQNPWSKIATGLNPEPGKPNQFTATDFDQLYDCPILAGNLEELPSFSVNGIKHRFIGYHLADFDKTQFMENLKRMVETAVAVIGDIPYSQYTFIGIGPGRGGIEHLNNTTISFDGKALNTPEGINRTMSFLAHEYFHHYNVKRIRPLELGPFDYDQPTRTNLLWVSEGLSVYYEYLIIFRARLIGEPALLGNFEKSIQGFEGNSGRLYQSLVQASYATWSEGPYGKQAADTNQSISYYDKGPVIGLLLDFTIRHATQNKKSLDDVMRLLYFHYYKELRRGFTDAEFQQACETIAGISLSSLFEYVYTTKEIDYNKYLEFAGLYADIKQIGENRRLVTLRHIDNPDEFQTGLFNSWMQGQMLFFH